MQLFWYSLFEKVNYEQKQSINQNRCFIIQKFNEVKKTKFSLFFLIEKIKATSHVEAQT
jgi:hypothetical protein